MTSTSTLPRSILGALVPSLLLASAATAMQSPPQYHVTDLRDAVEQTFPGVEFSSSRSRGLNENGDLVGEASTGGSQQQSWIYTVEHGLAPLPLLPGWSSNVALDISDRDANGVVTIVGGGIVSIYWDISIGEAMLWRYSTVSGTVLETRSIGIPAGYSDSLAVAVNDGGTVVGYSHNVGPFAAWKYDVATQALSTFSFPVRPTDVNNAGQVCGGSYRGDLFGNYQDLGVAPGTNSTSFAAINDAGSMVARAGTSISDGAGHHLVTVVRWSDTTGWKVLTPFSHLTLAGAINNLDDFTSAQGGIYLESDATYYSVSSLLAPEFHTYGANWIAEFNDNRQIAAVYGHAILLTPLGVMVIPGDINGDVQVDLDDLCAFNANPIDLDGDGSVTGADYSWLIARLAVFGHSPSDCNANGVPDRCDITSGASPDCDLNGVPDACQPDCNGDGVPDACEPDCNGNGTPDPCDVIAGTSEDCNVNGVPDECDGGWTVAYANEFDPPLFVPVNAFLPNDIVVNEIGLVGDVDFTIDIGYRIGYLTVLLSHNGTTITLIERPGHPETFLGNGQGGYDIILDDEGTGGEIEHEGNFGSPFGPILSPPSFTPNEALSAFDGMPMAGTWTVTVITDPVYSSVPEEWNDWGLTITSESESVPPCVCQTLVTNYCSSSPNSTGSAALITSNLECSVADNSLELVATPVPNSTGLFFYGPAQASVPFGNGLRCVAAGGLGLFRLPARLAANNSLNQSLDLSNPPQASGAITPSSTWFFQAWYRDMAAGGAQFDTSDGLRISFIP